MPERSVLFVCLGNICRSPSAEGVLRAKLSERGLRDVRVDSAGTGPWHIGEPPDPRAQAAARRRGIDIAMLRGRQVGVSDFLCFDHLFAMDSANLAALRRLAPARLAGRARLLLDLLPHSSLRDVPDPFTGDDSDFDAMFELLDPAIDALVNWLQREPHR